jgi:hypothetical protein
MGEVKGNSLAGTARDQSEDEEALPIGFCFSGHREFFPGTDIGDDTDAHVYPDTDQHECGRTEQEMNHGSEVDTEEKCKEKNNEKYNCASNRQYEVPDLMRCPEIIAHVFTSITMGWGEDNRNDE